MNEDQVNALIATALQNYNQSSLKVPRHTHNGVDSPLIAASSNGLASGTVTTISVASANGFTGTVANPTTTPAITLTTSITGILQGNGTAISAITVGTGLSFSAGTLSSTVASSPYTVNADETSSTAFTTQINFITVANTSNNGWTLTSAGANASYFPIGSNGFAVSNAGSAGLVGNARMNFVAPSASNPTTGFSADTPNTIRLRFYGHVRSTTPSATNRVAVGFSDLTGGSDFYSETATDGRDVKFVFDCDNSGHTPTTYAVCSNASAVTTTNLNVDPNTFHIYEIVLIPQTSAKFYIDGTLETTITTDLYASGSQVMYFEIGSYNFGSITDIEIYMLNPTLSITK